MPWLPSVIWLALLIMFALAEAATVGLVSIWFAAGSLVALLSTFFTDSIWVQITIFLAVSAATLAVARPLARKYLTPEQVATNADRVIGREAVVTEEIDNLKGCGAVSVGGITWTARSDSGDVISVGKTVKALRIEGVKLFVTPVPTGKE
ncbi:MAG: NfeD family protein [Pseudoflavonifractor sp.]|nr:NfeD family protein [Pseudoflavonifractor sp.]